MKKITKIKEQLSEYRPRTIQEETDLQVIIDALEEYGEKIFYRESTLFHMTSSAIILNEKKDKVLFAYHLIYKSYAWLGGHADGECDLFEVTCKEIKEESGLENITPISGEIASVEILPVKPHFKNGKMVPHHLHLNVTYLFIASDKANLQIKPDENSSLKWIPIHELENFVTEEEMLDVYKKIISREVSL